MLSRRAFYVPLYLCLLIWFAHYQFRGWGLYEDDFFFIGDAMARDISYLPRRFVNDFTTFPEGRPIGFFAAAVFAFV